MAKGQRWQGVGWKVLPALRHSPVEKFHWTQAPATLRSGPQEGESCAGRREGTKLLTFRDQWLFLVYQLQADSDLRPQVVLRSTDIWRALNSSERLHRRSLNLVLTSRPFILWGVPSWAWFSPPRSGQGTWSARLSLPWGEFLPPSSPLV